jgi:hypothetical protein
MGKNEFALYAPMVAWLTQRLKDQYEPLGYTVIVEDTHAITLEKALRNHGVLRYFQDAVGIDIEIDVLGIIIKDEDVRLFFIEAKDENLKLKDVGQLLIYCRIVPPHSAYLLSSKGLGQITKLVTHLGRNNLLEYQYRQQSTHIVAARWDVSRNCVDWSCSVP